MVPSSLRRRTFPARSLLVLRPCGVRRIGDSDSHVDHPVFSEGHTRRVRVRNCGENIRHILQRTAVPPAARRVMTPGVFAGAFGPGFELGLWYVK